MHTRLISYAAFLYCIVALTLTPTHASEAETASQTYNIQITANDMTLGEPTAPVTIVEYASLSCVHCAHFHNDTFPKLKKQYIDTGKVRFAYRDFPFNAPALHGAMLAHCAGPQQYFTFLKVLFRTQDKWAFGNNYKDNLKNIAALGGLGGAAFNQCLENTALEAQLINVKKEAYETLKVNSTPTLFINGQKIAGGHSIEELKKIIDPLLKKASSSE